MTHQRPMNLSLNSFAGLCSRDQIAELQQHIHSCALAQHEICAKFAPATRRSEFNLLSNLLSFMGHDSPATCPVSVYLTRFCPRAFCSNMFLQHVSSCGPTFIPQYTVSFSEDGECWITSARKYSSGST